MEEEIRKHDGINLHLNETVLEILEENGKIKGVKTNKGEYSADLAVVATGVKPNTAFLKDTEIKNSAKRSFDN